MLAEVGLADRLGSAIDAFSGGEQQRVAIARALVHEPKLLLADEPTGNLDEETARQVFPLVMSLVRKHGATLLLVTHDRRLAASADRVLEMRDGKLLAAPDAADPHRLGAGADASSAGAQKLRAGEARPASSEDLPRR
jgi:predicted ABC-type transport system involved in lysophospholipase L1 biosynthesis ATPase subunit